MTSYATIDRTIGNTPLVQLQRLPAAHGVGRGTVVLGKLEGNNPGGSVKDRPVLSMIRGAEARGEIRPGDRLIEATSGNTGIAMAMIAAMTGYQMTLLMRAYGAELILTPAAAGGMEHARDLAMQMQARGEGRVLDQFANPDNPRAHYQTTGPEIWRDTGGRITHFVSAMGTTGTIMGVGRFLREQRSGIHIIGAQPSEGSQIAGIRKWSAAYQPRIYDATGVDRIELVSQQEAEDMARRLAAEEGVFCGPSAAGACVIALRLAAEVENATIVFIVCDRGDRYLSTGIFPA
jgi:S-sulfo-L-cysteine synthase (O-acetyl-L-serine-dependent)